MRAPWRRRRRPPVERQAPVPGEETRGERALREAGYVGPDGRVHGPYCCIMEPDVHVCCCGGRGCDGCDHLRDDHGPGDPSTACSIPGCHCTVFVEPVD